MPKAENTEVYTSGLKITAKDKKRPVRVEDMDAVKEVKKVRDSERERPQGVVARVIQAIKELGDSNP